MTTIAEKRKRVLQIITQHADIMSGTQLDQAIFVWDRLVKSEINKPLPVVPNREKGKWEAKTDATNNRNDGTSSGTQNDREQKSTGEIGNNKDHKPVSTNKWKLKMPSGRTYLYVMNDSGAVTRKEVDDYIPTYKEAVPTFDHEHISTMHEHIQADRSEEKDNKKEKKPVETIKKSLPPLRWGQTPRFLGEKVGNTTPSTEPQRTTPVTPAPTAAQQFRESRINISQLNGHQLAAQRCGLDPHTPGVESMTVDQMKQAAHEVNVRATAPLAFKAGLQYRR